MYLYIFLKKSEVICLHLMKQLQTYLDFLFLIFTPLVPAGSLGDLDGGEENTADTLSLSGEEGGASDPDDSAEGDSSSPPPYTPLYNDGNEDENAAAVGRTGEDGSTSTPLICSFLGLLNLILGRFLQKHKVSLRLTH